MSRLSCSVERGSDAVTTTAKAKEHREAQAKAHTATQVAPERTCTKSALFSKQHPGQKVPELSFDWQPVPRVSSGVELCACVPVVRSQSALITSPPAHNTSRPRGTELKIPTDRTELKTPTDRTELKIPTDRTELKTPTDRTELKIPTDRTELKTPTDRTELKIPTNKRLQATRREKQLQTTNKPKTTKSQTKTKKTKKTKRPTMTKLDNNSGPTHENNKDKAHQHSGTSPQQACASVPPVQKHAACLDHEIKDDGPAAAVLHANGFNDALHHCAMPVAAEPPKVFPMNSRMPTPPTNGDSDDATPRSATTGVNSGDLQPNSTQDHSVGLSVTAPAPPTSVGTSPHSSPPELRQRGAIAAKGDCSFEEERAALPKEGNGVIRRCFGAELDTDSKQLSDAENKEAKSMRKTLEQLEAACSFCCDAVHRLSLASDRAAHDAKVARVWARTALRWMHQNQVRHRHCWSGRPSRGTCLTTSKQRHAAVGTAVQPWSKRKQAFFAARIQKDLCVNPKCTRACTSGSPGPTRALHVACSRECAVLARKIGFNRKECTVAIARFSGLAVAAQLLCAGLCC